MATTTNQTGKWVRGTPSAASWTVAGVRNGTIYYRSPRGVLWCKRGDQWYRWQPAKASN